MIAKILAQAATEESPERARELLDIAEQEAINEIHIESGLRDREPSAGEGALPDLSPAAVELETALGEAREQFMHAFIGAGLSERSARLILAWTATVARATNAQIMIESLRAEVAMREAAQRD